MNGDGGRRMTKMEESEKGCREKRKRRRMIQTSQ